MTTPVLISAAELSAVLGVAGAIPRHVPVVLDARWNLVGRDGREEFEDGHVPGARFVEMHGALAGPAGPGGRHPLPTVEQFQAAMRRAGVDDGPVVVMDGGAPLAAARLWWLLTDAGHDDVRVLDGGFTAWRAAGGAVATGPSPVVPPSEWIARPGRRRTVCIETVATLAASAGSFDPGSGDRGDPDRGASGADTGSAAGVEGSDADAVADGSGADGAVDSAGAAGALGARGLDDGGRRLVDVRAGERFRGEHEPIDPVAGHIPGAINVESSASFRDGLFRSPAELAAHFDAAGVDGDAVVYCGSGITACQTLLAMAVAGCEPATLFAGSWSAWVATGDRPVATGE